MNKKIFVLFYFAALVVSRVNATAPNECYDFDRLSNLIKRLDVIEDSAEKILIGFYEPHLCSFSVKPDNTLTEAPVTTRVCVTSTCYALLTMVLSAPNVYESVISYESISSKEGSNHSAGHGSFSRIIPIRKIVETLLETNWREDDLFQVPLVLYTILQVDQDRSLLHAAARNPQVANRIRNMLKTILNACPDPVQPSQTNSEYISYQVCKVLAVLQQSSRRSEDNSTNDKVGIGGMPASTLPKDMGSELFPALQKCSRVSFQTMCRMLALRSAGDTDTFDVMRLAYSLLSYIRSTQCLSALAGRELEPGKGPSPETKISPLNQKLVTAALKAFFEEQKSDGLWDKGQPIYKSFRRRGRNMGNAFVFPVNTVGSLLCSLPAENFRPYLRELEKTLHWLETHQTVEMVFDYCDPETGQCYGRPLRGWSSPHSPENTGPQAWPTAQALKCVSWIKKTIRELMHNDVLEEFNGIAFSKDSVRADSWNRLLDTDLGNPAKGPCRTIKSVLEERVVVPFSKSIDKPSYGAAYSAILFGPPGTAKTTICEALAQRMGWDFVVVDTAAFLADGLSNVAARIRYVFSRLMALNECIILFDEIEEFALDRETPGLSMESRMLTTAMLTAINDLRRTKRSVFFIATNRLRAFDAAITRRGRFDMQLFVGTPNLESRVFQLEQRLAGRGLDDETEAKAIHTYRQYLESVWAKDAMFMSYLEGIQFATAIADLVVAQKALSDNDMERILQQQAAVMTVRGPAREEYIATMELSRL